jgi:hypothetical protein
LFHKEIKIRTCHPTSSFKDLKIEIYKTIILPIFIEVRNFVFHAKGRTQIEGVWEQGAEENIWT